MATEITLNLDTLEEHDLLMALHVAAQLKRSHAALERLESRYEEAGHQEHEAIRYEAMIERLIEAGILPMHRTGLWAQCEKDYGLRNS